MRSLPLSLSLIVLKRVTLLVALGKEGEEAEEMPENHRVTIKSNYKFARGYV